MIIGFPAGTRGDFFDRNAITRVQTYLATAVTPHALTTRASYTVPGTKKYAIGSYSLNNCQFAASTTHAEVRSSVRITPSGGAQTAALDLFSPFQSSGIFPPSSIAGLQGLVLQSNDLLEITTVDLSTGTQIDYALSGAGIEFDA